MKITLITLLLTTPLVMAHPGPPGHTHSDEWPFGALAVIAVIGLIAFFVKKSARS